MMRVLDLFSGIGGFSLGLERTGGFRTAAFCEIEPFCRRVLAKHWPEVPCYDDVRTLTAERLRADGIPVDVICGGFPCQDISLAGKGAGLAGERSGLWAQYARLIGELRPAYVIVENVSALLGRGLGTVLGDLAALGFDAEWHCIPASAVGAPHRRDRIWIVAYPGRQRSAGRREPVDVVRTARASEADREERQRDGDAAHHCRPVMADADRPGPHAGAQAGIHRGEAGAGPRDGEPERLRGPLAPGVVADSGTIGRLVLTGLRPLSGWSSEPDVGRVANGVPARVDRLRSLGNAVVPQIPELIGHAILAAEAQREQAAA